MVSMVFDDLFDRFQEWYKTLEQSMNVDDSSLFFAWSDTYKYI